MERAEAGTSGQSRVLSEDAFSELISGYREAASRLNETAMTSRRMRIPALKNMTNNQFLNEFLGLRDILREPHVRDGGLEGAWVEELSAQLSEVEDKLRRIHFKSLGGMLGLQESLLAKWRVEHSAEAVAVLPSRNPPTVQPSAGN
jgi:hypothetical protein